MISTPLLKERNDIQPIKTNIFHKLVLPKLVPNNSKVKDILSSFKN